MISKIASVAFKGQPTSSIRNNDEVLLWGAASKAVKPKDTAQRGLTTLPLDIEAKFASISKEKHLKLGKESKSRIARAWHGLMAAVFS